ncbi:UDP-N-acetylmuramate dehydrogenase [Lysinibacter cavernae]|uniref:UDP-N-acetylenolpyruvoylglucosamine reductase n=1 Tax=Lysinibacter cavernae TaxID=1640652 RepID=A0A7X5TTL8_9MICO|nr:UDP-N-acetylmuramate dehydrogenase [Lysinibacter cavernae]NIH54340.1 UDP-N-acetylmuramate dehydrogenase [Lysinibacter cavernae]
MSHPTPRAVEDELFFRDLTTMKVGGQVERAVVATTSDELVAAATDAWQQGDDWMLLAGGSNTVVAEEGFEGTVILVRSEGIERLELGPDADPLAVRLRIQAGHSWDAVVEHAVANGWAGIEALSGIPGSAGAAPIQNIGAYGQEVAEVLHSVTFLDHETGVVSRIPASELGLGYRTSVIKQGRLGVVLSIDINLVAGEDTANPLSSPVRYAQLADALAIDIGSTVAIKELRRTVIRLRASKGMVLDPADQDSVSAGSFFTNPIVTESFARALPPGAPRWPVQPEDQFVAVTSLEELASGMPLRQPDTHAGPRMEKLSAAWLIEQSGITRGYQLPGSQAAISSKHTLAITNRGRATANDVAQLARFVQQRVQSEFGVTLQPEPVLIGLEL